MGIEPSMRMVGIVLAGGQSRRFGEPKALQLWKGKSFLSYSIAALQPSVDEIIVISHLKELVHPSGTVVREDLEEYRGMGPLAGILTGMEAAVGDWYIVLPCDVPLVTNEIMMRIVGEAEEDVDAVVPIVAGRTQPLFACYHKSVKEKLRLLLREDKRSMKELLSLCKVAYVIEEKLGVNTQAFVNVNTKEEYMNLP